MLRERLLSWAVKIRCLTYLRAPLYSPTPRASDIWEKSTHIVYFGDSGIQRLRLFPKAFPSWGNRHQQGHVWWKILLHWWDVEHLVHLLREGDLRPPAHIWPGSHPDPPWILPPLMWWHPLPFQASIPIQNSWGFHMTHWSRCSPF